MADLRDDIDSALGAVLFNSMNHPNPSAVLGRDVSGLRNKCVDAVWELVRHKRVADNGIVMPTARITIEYGLDDRGETIMAETWENLADPDEPVDMLTKAGMLTMAQQTLTYFALGLDDS